MLGNKNRILFALAIICILVAPHLVSSKPHKSNKELLSVNRVEDIPSKYRDTPIESLLTYHNLNVHVDRTEKAQIVIGMCMDNRKMLNVPENFAFIIRAAGANLEFSHFPISFAVGVAGVQYMAIIGHDDCAMVNLESKRERFIDGLVNNAQWSRKKAETQFDENAPIFEIHDEIEFVLKQTKLLRKHYPTLTIVPMLYKVGDGRLYIIKE